MARHRILATVDCVPAGRVATYGQIATAAGLPRRARLVGRVLSELPAGAGGIPWHRVVDATGRIAHRGDPASEREQARRLEREGLRVVRGRVDLKRFAWQPELGTGPQPPPLKASR